MGVVKTITNSTLNASFTVEFSSRFISYLNSLGVSLSENVLMRLASTQYANNAIPLGTINLDNLQNNGSYNLTSTSDSYVYIGLNGSLGNILTASTLSDCYYQKDNGNKNYLTYTQSNSNTYMLSFIGNSFTRLALFTDSSHILIDYDSPVDRATFNNSLDNCTLSNPIAEYESGSTYTTLLSADTHYYFDSTPYIQYYKNGTLNTVNFTKISNYQYSLSFTDSVDNNSVISIIADSTICKPIKVNVVNNVDSHISGNVPTVIYEYDLPEVIILEKPSSLTFDVTTLTYYDRSNTLQTINGTIDLQYPDEVIFRIPNTVEFYPDSTLTVNCSVISFERNINYNLSHCTPNATPSIYTLGDVVNYVFTPDSGYFFNVIPSLSYYKNGNQLQIDGTIVNGIGYLTLNLTEIDSNTSIDVFATCIKEDSIITKTYNNIIGVYKVSKSNIEDISTIRFSVVDTEYIYQEIDLGKYISSLKRYFINIPTIDTGTIKLGNTNINSVAGIIDNDIYTISLGVQNIPRIFNTQNDFTDIDIFALLPFIGKIQLDNSFIDRNVRIDYKINIVSDDCKIIFSDNDTDEILLVSDCLISIDIPYKTLTEKSNYIQNIENLVSGVSTLKDIQPCIILRSKNIISSIENETDFVSTLNLLSGRVSISDCDLSNIFALKQELELIMNELKKGIIL